MTQHAILTAVGKDLGQKLPGATTIPQSAAQLPTANRIVRALAHDGLGHRNAGIVQQCLELSIDYAKNRVQFGKPIGEFQLIQDKLARMEVARLNVQNLVFRHIETQAAGEPMTLAEASAMKLYSARAATEVAMEAVQLFGGNGYTTEHSVERYWRDARLTTIFEGTSEIQRLVVARAISGRQIR